MGTEIFYLIALYYLLWALGIAGVIGAVFYAIRQWWLGRKIEQEKAKIRNYLAQVTDKENR